MPRVRGRGSGPLPGALRGRVVPGREVQGLPALAAPEALAHAGLCDQGGNRMTADRIVSVDVGGAFTAVVAGSGGRILTSKVPTNPMSSDQSVLAGAAEVRVDRAAVFNL